MPEKYLKYLQTPVEPQKLNCHSQTAILLKNLFTYRVAWPFLSFLNVYGEKDIKMVAPNALLNWLLGALSFRFQDERDFKGNLGGFHRSHYRLNKLYVSDTLHIRCE